MSRGSGAGTSRPPLTPPNLPDRWLHAEREERLVRWLKRGLVVLVVVGTAALALNWWIVDAYLAGRERVLAEACLDSPFAGGSVTAAGGAEAVTQPDAEALAPYREDPEWRDSAALRIRDHASLIDDRALAAAAVAVTGGGPFHARGQIARVEEGCRHYIDAEGLTSR